MKQLIHLIIFLAFWGNLAAQRPYQPMVVEGATWIQSRIDGEFGFIEKRYGYRIMSDTVISGQHWAFLYVMPASDTDVLDFREKILAGFLREDTSQGKVYFRSASILTVICNESIGDEVLLYDFSVSIGDTTHQCLSSNSGPPGEVTAISSVNSVLDIPVFGLDSLLFYQLGDTSFFDPNRVYYEAVGNVAGIIKRRPDIPGTTFPFTDRSLVKYCRNDSLCGLHLITSLNKPNPPISIIAHSNIVDPGQNINLNHSVKSLILITLAGKIIHIEQNDRSFSIPFSCCSGMYVLKGVDHYGNTFSQKIIVR